MAVKQTDRSFLAGSPAPERGASRVSQPAAPPAPVSVVEYGGRRVIIVVGIMMAALLQTLDATIVNVALPTIEGNVGAAIDDGTWIITGYIISNVVAIPLAPFFLQRFGRRAYYATCIIGFTVASFLCGTATDLWTLVAFRIVQGAFGGGLIATSQIILRDTFPPEKFGAAAGLFAIALTFGPALGPTLGGILTDAYSWQWVFDINLVPGTIAAIIILTMLRNPTAPRRMPFDGLGLALLIAALASLQFVLDEGERYDWFDDTRIVVASAAFVAGLAAFVVWEVWGTKTPIVDLRIFRYRNARFGTLAAVVIGMVLFGPTVIMPQYVQSILGFTSTLSGLLILMRALPVLALTPFIARFVGRIDFRWFLCAGYTISAASFVVLASHMTSQSDFGAFAWVLAVSGIGQSMLLVPLLVGLLGTIPPADAPKVSSFISLSVQMGGSIVSTLVVTIFDRRTYFHSDVLRANASLAHRAVLLNAHVSFPALVRLLRLEAADAGFADAVFLLAPIACVGVVLALLLRRGSVPVAAAAVAAE